MTRKIKKTGKRKMWWCGLDVRYIEAETELMSQEETLALEKRLYELETKRRWTRRHEKALIEILNKAAGYDPRARMAEMESWCTHDGLGRPLKGRSLQEADYEILTRGGS
jgi:hypothetical protein